MMCRKLCSCCQQSLFYGIALSRGNIATRASSLLAAQQAAANYLCLFPTRPVAGLLVSYNASFGVGGGATAVLKECRGADYNRRLTHTHTLRPPTMNCRRAVSPAPLVRALAPYYMHIT